MYVCTYVRMYVCMYVPMYVCMYVPMCVLYVCTYARVYVRTYARMYVCAATGIPARGGAAIRPAPCAEGVRAPATNTNNSYQ